MAQIHEEVVVIKLSKLIKDKSENAGMIANNDVCAALEQVAQELVGDAVIVEVERA